MVGLVTPLEPDSPPEELSAVWQRILLGRGGGGGHGHVVSASHGFSGHLVIWPESGGGGRGVSVRPPLGVLTKRGGDGVGLKLLYARDADPAEHPVPDHVPHGEAGDVVHGGGARQDDNDVPAGVVHQIVVPVVLVGDVHVELIRAGAEAGLEPVALLAARVEVEGWNEEASVIKDLDWVRAKFLQTSLVKLGESLKKEPPWHFRIMRNEYFSKVDSKPGTPDT